MTSPNKPEPAPKPNDSPAIWDLVIADMHERDQQGLAKYGVRLQAGNGREPLVDAYQESLDLAVYLRQAIEESKRQAEQIKRLRARVIVNAEDVTAAGITLEHVRAWLTARGWGPCERGITVDDPVRGRWRLWERLPTPEEQARREAFRKATKRWPSRASDEPNIAVYDGNTPAQLADLIAGVARTFKLVGLDLVDELAESVRAEARSDQA